MKKIRSIISSTTLGICLLLTGCQDLDTPWYNPAPTVTSNEPSNVTAHSATVTGTITINMNNDWNYNPEFYFLVSTSSDLSNAKKYSAYFSDENNKLYGTLNELERNTTYYYALCATDGFSEVRGEIKSFTTNGTIGIGNVSITGWNGEVTGEKVPAEIGTFLMHSNGNYYSTSYANKKAQYNGSSWQLPYDLEATSTALKFYAYAPYENHDYGEAYIDIYTYKSNVDYLYGSSEDITESHPTVNITMKHALAKVIFSVTNTSTNTITHLIIKNNEEKESALKTYGFLNLITGEISQGSYTEAIHRDVQIPINKENPQAVEVFTIPVSFSNENILLSFNSSDHDISKAITSATWEAGKQYTYPVTINESELIIGNVKVENWNNGGGDDITVNN